MTEQKAASPSLDKLSSTRRVIKPAADENIDPIETKSPSTATPATQQKPPEAPGKGRRGKSEPTIQLGTRVAEVTADQLDELTTKTGRSKRDLIQEFIAMGYAKYIS